MGIYVEYLNMDLDINGIEQERKKQLQKISQLRGGRDILVFAAGMQKNSRLTMIAFDDVMYMKEILSDLQGTDKLDIILETPGGYAEYTEILVRMIRNKYSEVSFIVPGMAMSAGTIMAMSGDEILMENSSSLGPIDAQLNYQGKSFSADAFIEGLKKIKKEVSESGDLNKAFIPILQNISPGEIQNAENALSLSKTLVTNWLIKYKFKNWVTHRGDGSTVTPEERESQAAEIAGKLCEHSTWLSHGRSINIDDLRGMGLEITDYGENSDLCDAIRKFYVLLQRTFESNIYKIFETTTSQVYRFEKPVAQDKKGNQSISIESKCGKCQTPSNIQLNLGGKAALKDKHLKYPENDIFQCPNCGAENNLKPIRLQLEQQFGNKSVFEYNKREGK